MNRASVARFYTELHEGLPPSSIRPVRIARPTKIRIDLGRATAIEYDKPTTKGLEAFRHDYAPGAGPMLQTDENGRLHNSGGSYRVTTRGITDVKKNTRYRRGYSQAMRANPTSAKHMMNYTQFAMEGAKIGGTTLALTIISDMAFRRTDLTYGMRATISAGFGIIGGLLIARWMPAVGIGFVTYGLTYGGRYLAASVNMQRFLANVTSGTRAQLPAPNTTTTMTTTPNANSAGMLPGPRGAGAIGAVRMTQPRMAERIAA